jgi:hypothetical protein
VLSRHCEALPEPRRCAEFQWQQQQHVQVQCRQDRKAPWWQQQEQHYRELEATTAVDDRWQME